MIAGRLPGRTANDVKNYWNCHLSKRLNALEAEDRPITRDVQVIRPQPRNIGSSSVKRRGGQNESATDKGVQQESSMSSLTFDASDGQNHMLESQQDNDIYACLDQQGIVSELSMDFQLQGFEAMMNGEGSSSQWDWGDYLLDMDFYE